MMYIFADVRVGSRSKEEIKMQGLLFFREGKGEKNFVFVSFVSKNATKNEDFFRGQISGSGESIFREEWEKYFCAENVYMSLLLEGRTC